MTINSYLKPLVTELLDLSHYGVTIKQNMIRAALLIAACDLPAIEEDTHLNIINIHCIYHHMILYASCYVGVVSCFVSCFTNAKLYLLTCFLSSVEDM